MNKKRSAVVIGLGNQKGGAGKTTDTVHLTAALAERGRKCLIWDLDMNRGATKHLGVPSETFLGTYEVLTAQEEVLDVILTEEEEELNLPENLHLISARRNLEAIDKTLATSKFLSPSDILKNPIRSLRSEYDYILLDTAPNATAPTIAAYNSADYFILTTSPEPLVLEGLNDAMMDIADVKKFGNRGLELLGVILSRVDLRTRIGRDAVDQVGRFFSTKKSQSRKFKTIISASTVVPNAQKEEVTLFEYAPRHKVTQQYRRLAIEVEERLTQYQTKRNQQGLVGNG